MAEKLKSRRVRLAFTIVALLAMVGVAYGIRDEIADTIRSLHDANLWLVLTIVPFIGINHFFQGGLYQSLFRMLGNRFRLKPMVRLSLELNFVNNAFPSAGVSGFSYLGFRMHGEKVPAGRSTLVQAMRFMLMFVAFQLLLGLGLLMLALSGGMSNFVMLVAGSMSTLLVVGTLLGVYVISSKQRIKSFFSTITRGLNRVFQAVRPSRNPETITISKVEQVFSDLHDNYVVMRKDLGKLRRPFLFAFLSNLVEVSSIYIVFLAFGQVINPGAVILAYAVANFAGIISVLPGGIGIYEGLMTGVLAASGVPVSVSLPAIVTFRVVSMGIQLPIGYLLYYYHVNDKKLPI